MAGSSIRLRVMTVGVVLAACLVLLAQLLLVRLEAAQLFLLPCPWDRAASGSEQQDAVQTTRQFHVAALAAVAILTMLAVHFGTRIEAVCLQALFSQPLWLVLLVIATAADLGTTLWFMHARGIELEVHPGLRLFAEALGRTSGPVLGKLFQLAGLIFIGLLGPRWWPWLSIIAASCLIWAAMHNAWLMLGAERL